MARYKRDFTEKKKKQFIREKRGMGTGDDYKPWLRVRDVASNGNSYRLQCAWTEHSREVHLFSTLELRWFFVFDWDTRIVDIREQFPLRPLERTQSIAKELGYKHPTDPKTQNHIVMTSDFYLTVRQEDGSLTDVLRTAKRDKTLDGRRIREKLHIEELFWKQGDMMDWGIITEQNLDMTLVRNIEILRGYIAIDDRLQLSPTRLVDIASLLTTSLETDQMYLIEVVNQCDRKFNLRIGTSLTIAYFLLANRYWKINMQAPLNPHTLYGLQSHSLPRLKSTLQETSA